MTSHDNVTDIEWRLREQANEYTTRTGCVASLECEAADTIATLRKQLENAREALHSIEGQAVCVALPHKASEADDMLENIAGIAALALESIYALKGQPC